ncbi:MAG: hypothetical protein KatS3mg006_0370 [Pyrinomonadaceae bacterium]|jgi:hypothetical protein|nr:MAG: hypothetical protein KatS3mg006_0370 [Pyrinomonadaceae bacterium]
MRILTTVNTRTVNTRLITTNQQLASDNAMSILESFRASDNERLSKFLLRLIAI